MKSEEELAAHVVEWLQSDGWEVFQEVQLSTYGERADIVARRDGILWAIEVKKSLTFEVIAQARRWIWWAHHGSIAVPRTKGGGRNHGRELAFQVCAAERVGIITVGKDSWEPRIRVKQDVAPALNRRNEIIEKPWVKELNNALTPERKDFAKAGNADGRRWTPFQATCEEALIKARAHPGITLKNLVDSISHHYASPSSARGSLAKWIRKGSVKGLEIKEDGRKLLIYPKEK